MLQGAIVLFLVSLLPVAVTAQAPAPKATPEPDTLLLNDGEKLIGHLVRSSGSSVIFKSDILGEITVDASKIKELHAGGQYAVVGKNVNLGRHPDLSSVPHGSLDVAAETITVHSAGTAPVTVPVADSAHVVDETTFQKDIAHNPGFFEGWVGAITAGATLVQATQESRSFTGGVAFVRAIPGESWLGSRDRTIFDFSGTEGSVNQPNTPRIKTQIIHSDLERDEYLSGRLYAFGNAVFDHNYSQGLDLQQNYGGGIGFTAMHQENTTLDFKGSVSYVRQNFQTAANDHNLIASTFSQSLTHKFSHGMVFLEGIGVTPAWNEMNAWMATSTASFTIPVYKRLNFTIGILDSFLNDPPIGFRKNSFQATTGLTYTLR